MTSPAPPLPGGLGKSVRRKEDRPLVTGAGAFPSDFTAERMLHAYVLRSPHAHARFRIDDITAARALEGVAGIWTGEDIAGFGTLPAPGLALVAQQNGLDLQAPPFPLLARDRVRFVGDAIVFIVAEDLATAQSAAELIEIAFDPLEAVTDAKAARLPGAPLVHDAIAANTLYEVEIGDRAATERAFGAARRTIGLDLVNQRLVSNYMEPRSVLARYSTEDDSFSLVLGSQGVHSIRAVVAGILGVDPDKVQVLTPADVGGGFGTRFFAYREYALAAVAARDCKRPVKWLSDRSEHFLADYHGRDHLTRVEMAVGLDGRFEALRVETTANLGAYLGQLGAFVPYFGSRMDQGLYDIPAVHILVRGVMTNTVPTDAYRGAGRPEAAFLIERIVDRVARELGMAQDAIRRKNFIRPESFPYRTQTGHTYDVGEFERHLDAALAQADWAGFDGRLSDARAKGRLRGIGIASYIEACSGFSGETTRLILEKDGTITLLIGSQATGQGHQTAFAQMAAAHLGLDIEAINVVQGDTQRIPTGSGTGGSRSIPVGSVIVDRAARVLRDRIIERAAGELEADPTDIELSSGTARIAGTDRGLSLAEIAGLQPEPIEADAEWTPEGFTYPNGTHVCEVEIDPETGVADIVTYVAVDDFGVAVNPMLLDGQVAGGIAQGIGQALLEHAKYDPESGQLLSASLTDYALPRADVMPPFQLSYANVPSTNNPLGIKGAGEAGTIGAVPAVVNAVVDALDRAYGITHIDMPLTPARVWQAIRAAEAISGEA